MTEQSKIPLPGEGKGKSLFERAEDLFGLDSFAPAPVPEQLACPTNAPVTRKAASAMPAPKPVEEAAPVSAHPVAAPPAAAEPEPAPKMVEAASAAPPAEEQPIRFTGEPQRIDRRHLAEQGLIQLDGRVTALLEEFRIVKRQLLLAARAGRRNGGGAPAQRVLVCSPLPGEGKTFCATNLALAMAAEKDSEVLLVDADFAKPSILSTLGLAGGRGLMDALADPSIRVEECVIATDIPGCRDLIEHGETGLLTPAGDAAALSEAFARVEDDAELRRRLGAKARAAICDGGLTWEACAHRYAEFYADLAGARAAGPVRTRRAEAERS